MKRVSFKDMSFGDSKEILVTPKDKDFGIVEMSKSYGFVEIRYQGLYNEGGRHYARLIGEKPDGRRIEIKFWE